jgi:cytochrome c oxidase subunit II
MHWWYPTLPVEASSYSGQVDRLFYICLYLTGFVFIVVEAALIWFLFIYRRREGRKAQYIEGSTTAEIIWTSIPAITCVLLGLISQPLWSKIKDHDKIPAGAIPLGVNARQFEWHITYPGPDRQLGTDDDFEKRGELHLIVDSTYAFTLTSQDVIHSFYIPVFRLKQDAVPGMTIHGWFRPTRAGEYEIGCAELCGLGHYRMRGRVWVHTADEFARWQQSQIAPPPPAAPAAPTSPRGD